MVHRNEVNVSPEGGYSHAGVQEVLSGASGVFFTEEVVWLQLILVVTFNR